eukprot:354857-Chlamydomonas_euryale.AAC.8
MKPPHAATCAKISHNHATSLLADPFCHATGRQGKRSTKMYAYYVACFATAETHSLACMRSREQPCLRVCAAQRQRMRQLLLLEEAQRVDGVDVMRVHTAARQQAVRWAAWHAVEVARDNHGDVGTSSNLLEALEQRVHLPHWHGKHRAGERDR